MMINWVHDIAIIIVSSMVASLLTASGWLIERVRSRRNARLLISSEILDNYSLLIIFLETLKAISSQDRLDIALHIDEIIHYTPQWLHVRWDNLPSGVCSPKEICQIAWWYHQLQSISVSYQYILSQAALLRQRSENGLNKQSAANFVVAVLDQLEKSAQDLYKQERPLIDKRLDKAKLENKVYGLFDQSNDSLLKESEKSQSAINLPK